LACRGSVRCSSAVRQGRGILTVAPPGFSEDAARRVDEEIRALVMHGHETARQIIERHRRVVEALAAELLDVESVDGERLKQIVAQHTQN
jgi:cell division protease FtsH